jgi:adenylate cyclase class IV
VQRLEPQETTVVELKAKVDSLEPFRKKLESLKAEHVGIFRQVDTYYEVPQGRLKLRETEGENGASRLLRKTRRRRSQTKPSFHN